MDWAPHLRRIISTLGEDAAFTNTLGSASTVRGMFLSPYQAADMGMVGVVGSNPSFAAMTADLASVGTTATVRRGGVTYKVRATHPDDPSGITVLELRRP